MTRSLLCPAQLARDPRGEGLAGQAGGHKPENERPPQPDPVREAGAPDGPEGIPEPGVRGSRLAELGKSGARTIGSIREQQVLGPMSIMRGAGSRSRNFLLSALPADRRKEGFLAACAALVLPSPPWTEEDSALYPARVL